MPKDKMDTYAAHEGAAHEKKSKVIWNYPVMNYCQRRVQHASEAATSDLDPFEYLEDCILTS